MPRTNDAVAILNKRIGDDPALSKDVEQALVNARVAELIYRYRTEAGLTQQQLADLIRTKQPVISRLEDADYEGSSVSMLVRIASALNMRLHIDFVRPGPDKVRKSARPSKLQAV